MSFGIRLGTPEEFGIDDKRYWELLNVVDVQSITFSCEILPDIWALYEDFSGTLSLLDVGSRTGAGTALIGYLHQKFSLNRIKIETTAIDISESYLSYARKHYPLARFRRDDVTRIPDKSYDVVLCSHTIEHVPEPFPFLDHLKRVARDYVVIACPFEEKDLIAGHVNRLDHKFFNTTGATSLRVYKSVTWHQSLACVAIYDMRSKEAKKTKKVHP